MKLPIIISESGDVSFFASVQEAAWSMEPIDVRNGEYQVFDSAGKLLQAVATEPVMIVESDESVEASEELEAILRSFYSALGGDENWAHSASLSQLVSYGIERYVQK